MISVTAFVRVLLVDFLLVGLVATSSTVPAHATPTREQAQTLSSTPQVIAPKYAHATGNWNIKVKHWSKNFARGGQERIDRCQATLWWGSLPTGHAKRPTWLAGHNYCGFWRWDKLLPVGSHFKIRSPGGHVRKYEVYRRTYINRKTGSSAGLVLGDITLVTCRGPGMSFVYGRLRH